MIGSNRKKSLMRACKPNNYIHASAPASQTLALEFCFEYCLFVLPVNKFIENKKHFMDNTKLSSYVSNDMTINDRMETIYIKIPRTPFPPITPSLPPPKKNLCIFCLVLKGIVEFF